MSVSFPKLFQTTSSTISTSNAYIIRFGKTELHDQQQF